MPQLIGSVEGGYNGVTKEYPVADGVTVTAGDFVFLTAGRVTSAAVPGVTLLGMVIGGQSNDFAKTAFTAALTAVGDTAGTVKVLVAVDDDNKYVVANDNLVTTFSAAHVGTCFDLIGATGAQLVDTSTTAVTGQLECIEFGYKDDNTLGVYIINEHKYKVNG